MHVMAQLNFRNGVVVLRGESKDQPRISTLFCGPGVSRPSGFGELMEDYKCLNLTRPMAEQDRAGHSTAFDDGGIRTDEPPCSTSRQAEEGEGE